MEQNRVLLLGLLNAQGQHGYQIMEHMEKNLSLVANIKKATRRGAHVHELPAGG